MINLQLNADKAEVEVLVSTVHISVHRCDQFYFKTYIDKPYKIICIYNWEDP